MVIRAVRDPASARPLQGFDGRRFDLTDPGDLGSLLEGVEAVIHLGAILSENTRPAGGGDDFNVSGSRRLIEAARAAGVQRFVFLSSQSASRSSPTGYGRSKWDIEQLLDAEGDCSVRTGLVSGGPPRGLYGVLFRLTKRLPVLPVIRPGAPVYPLHVDDLCAGLLSLIEQTAAPPRLVRLAARHPVRFGSYVRRLARERLGRRVRLLPVPAGLILALCRVSELLPFLPTIASERVLGLKALEPMDADSIPSPEGLVLRDVFEVLAAEGNSRRLAAEGRTLMRYVLGASVPRGAVRRYVRAVRAEEDREPIDLGAVVHAWPRLLRASEPVGRSRQERMRRRLGLATRIVEMTTPAAPVFHNYRERPRWIAWGALIAIVALEALVLPLRWIATHLRPRD